MSGRHANPIAADFGEAAREFDRLAQTLAHDEKAAWVHLSTGGKLEDAYRHATETAREIARRLRDLAGRRRNAVPALPKADLGPDELAATAADVLTFTGKLVEIAAAHDIKYEPDELSRVATLCGKLAGHLVQIIARMA